MISDNDVLKMIFGFKIKYLRQKRGLTYQQLAEKAGMSLSYIHEVEKGKKYPKPAKINQLAEALGTDYDGLVSKKADKKIQPIIDLITSDFMKIFPLEMFGISPGKLFELFSNAPDRVNAFVGTIINTTRKYRMSGEGFYKMALRSFQDMHDNYFPDLEEAVKTFKRENGIKSKRGYAESELRGLLSSVYDISVDSESLSGKEELKEVRSYFDKDKKTLFLKPSLSEAQRNFLLARELGFQVMDLQERPYVTRILEAESFEKLLNNFKASYFAAAFLMAEESVVKDIRAFAQLPSWREKAFLKLLDDYKVTPEMLMQRLTNILPGKFGINDLFFLRLSGKGKPRRFEITKELHLSRLHNPYANENEEHYCRKWIAVNVMKRQEIEEGAPLVADSQISSFWQSDNQYLCLSYAKPDDNSPEDAVSVTIGMMINDELRKIIRFLGDPALPVREVNTTCERCAMPNCDFRAAPPVEEEKRLGIEGVKKALGGL